jgi:diguanylate cyclase (GGDEF)-like protein
MTNISAINHSGLVMEIDRVKSICMQFKEILLAFKSGAPNVASSIDLIIDGVDYLYDGAESQSGMYSIKKSVLSLQDGLKNKRMIERDACSSILLNLLSIPNLKLDRKNRELVSKVRSGLAQSDFSPYEFLQNFSQLMSVISKRPDLLEGQAKFVEYLPSVHGSSLEDVTGDLSLITRKVGREFELFSSNVMDLYPNNPEIVRLKGEINKIYQGDNKLIKIIDLMSEFSWALFKIHDVNINSDKEYISQLAIQFSDLASSCGDISKLNSDSRATLNKFNNDFSSNLLLLKNKSANSLDLNGLKFELTNGIALMQTDLSAYIKKQNEIINQQSSLIESQTHDLKNVNNKLVEANKIIVQDSLTGLSNRRGYDDYLSKEYLKWKSDKTYNLGLILIDIDYFKRVNDTYGHSVGDEVLQFIASVLAKLNSIYPNAYVSRYGGEEFAIVLGGIPNDKVIAAARIVHRAIEKNEFISADKSVKLKLTASLGVSFFLYEADTMESVFNGADRSLYKAKESGRNSVWISRSAALKKQS